MREIVLDTETTGLDPGSGHRVVEIGCIELFNHIATGNHFHCYINPERDMPVEAFNVHGLSEEFLKQHDTFDKVAEDFLAFIGEDPLVIHNAEFDIGFLNAELGRLSREPIPIGRAIDTVRLARKKFPGERVNLDTLCRRFGIDNSARSKHGALLDSELLAEVYLELVGGRQPGFSLAVESDGETVKAVRTARPPRPHQPSEAEREAWAAFMEKTVKDPIWNQ
jgi:DNA polymerase-3 subunit epsilon